MLRFVAIFGLGWCVVLAGCTREPRVVTPPTAPAVTTPLAAQRYQVTGTATSVVADRALTDPIAPPFTINVTERGVGGAEIDHATVGGQVVQINWNAGVPLRVRGPGPGLGLNVAAVRIDAKTITWSLDGAGRDLLPGTYTLASPVAVGNGGLGSPQDGVTFAADDATELSTRGGATIALTPANLRIEGRDGSLTMTGQLTLATPTEDRKVTTVFFTPGTYNLSLTPVAGGYRVLANLDGTVAAK